MEAKDYLRYLVEQIHTTVVATVDSDGLPTTAAIDMMDYDEDGLYFLTARGKAFYRRLQENENLALTGIKGEETMSSVSVTVQGKAREVGDALLDRLFEKNPYMNEIYPTEESRDALTVFKIYEGSGEWFDLSKNPIERASFTFGGGKPKSEGYLIGGGCVSCGLCYSHCPQGCIDFTRTPAVIIQEHCLHCGNCYEVCPYKIVVKGEI